MTTAEWLMSWYFWAPLVLCITIVAVVYFHDKKKHQRKTCPTCYSTRKKTRYLVRYWLSDYIYNDSPCEDEWHNRR